jgi:glycine/D-amino acid oxidase-like deaminating enzyme
MDLRTDYPYPLLRKGIIKSYPSAQKQMRIDVAVIGAGITGALVAYQLCKAGIRAAVFDKRHAGMGSTAASTSLLQYEIDVPLRKLIKKVGEKNAVKSYLLCQEAISGIEKIGKRLGGENTFRSKPSLQYASFKKDVADLKEEYNLRRNAGFEIAWLESADVKKLFGFEKPAGLLSGTGGEIDAYSFTHSLLAYCAKKETPVFDHTAIVHIRYNKKSVELLTGSGVRISAKKIIIACGFESGTYLPKKVEKFHSTYAIASEPLFANNHWYKDALIWETAIPYLYIRSTIDNRIIVGGRDEDFYGEAKRDLYLPKKADAICNDFKKLFPSIPFRTDFKWAGTFASTKDGLPYIGQAPGVPHTYFALGYGGNGITFSFLAANIITDLLNGRKNENASIFRFDR